MAAPEGIIRFCRHEQTLTFHIEGRGTMSYCLMFRRCAEQAVAGGVLALHIDLRCCTHMDSTFMGTLLYLKRIAARQEHGELLLLAPSSRCCQILEQMGLAGVFPIVAADEADVASWPELTADLRDVGACKRNIVQAHEELAALPGAAGEPFREVVRCLAAEPEARQAKEPI